MPTQLPVLPRAPLPVPWREPTLTLALAVWCSNRPFPHCIRVVAYTRPDPLRRGSSCGNSLQEHRPIVVILKLNCEIDADRDVVARAITLPLLTMDPGI